MIDDLRTALRLLRSVQPSDSWSETSRKQADGLIADIVEEVTRLEGPIVRLAAEIPFPLIDSEEEEEIERAERSFEDYIGRT